MTLSFSNTSRARSWRLARAISAGSTPAARTHSISADTAASTVASAVPSNAVKDSVYRKGCSVGRSAPETAEARPHSTSAVYSRAFRCGGDPRKLDHRLTPFAPVSTASRTSIGKKSGSRAAGA